MDLEPYLNYFGGEATDFRTAISAEKTVEQFERVLREHNIDIKPGSKLEAICLNIIRAADRQRDHGLIDLKDIDPEETAERLGFEFFAQKIVRLSGRPGFGAFIPHLALLNHEQCTPTLMVPELDGDVNNKVFELLFGLAVFENSVDFSLDDPVDSSKAGPKKHPDILACLDGKRWAFECKTICGSSAITAFERVQDAVNQIDASDAQFGIPVLYLRRLINLREFWPTEEPGNPIHELFGPPFRDPTFITGLIRDRVSERMRALGIENGRENVAKLFQGSKAIPSILLFVQSVSLIQGPTAPMPMRLTMLIHAPVIPNQDDSFPLLERLNRSLHDI